MEKKVNPQNPEKATGSKAVNTSWINKMRDSVLNRKTGSHIML